MLSGVLWVQWRPWSSYTVLGHTSMDKILQLLHCWWLEGVAPWWPGCRVKSSPESPEFYCSRFAPLSINMWRHHLPFIFSWMEHLQSSLFVPLLHFCLNWCRIHLFFFFLARFTIKYANNLTFATVKVCLFSLYLKFSWSIHLRQISPMIYTWIVLVTWFFVFAGWSPWSSRESAQRMLRYG